LSSSGFAAHVFAPSHFTSILAEMRTGNVMMLANLRAPEPRDIAFGLVRAGAIRAIRLTMIDSLHLEARVEVIPGSCFVGMDSAPSGNAPANDRDCLGLVFHDGRHGRAAPLADHHDATALAVLMFAPAPIDPRGAMIFRPDMATKPSTVDFNDPAQSGRRGVRCQSASQFVSRSNAVFACSPRLRLNCKLLKPFAALTNKLKAMSRVRTGSFR
jgi:hypothetical protein